MIRGSLSTKVKSICMLYLIAVLCVFCLAIACKAEAEDWTTYRYDNARSGVTDEWLFPPLSLRWKFVPTHAPKPAWMKPAEELQRTHFDSAYHVTIANGTVYFGSSVDNKVYAINAKNGEVKWTFCTGGPVRFAPVIWKNRIYAGSDDGYVYCLRAKDGKPIWRYRAGPSDEKVIGNGRMISLWPVRTSVLVDDGVVYFGAGVFPYEGIYICALRADDGTVIWKNDTIGDHAHELSYGGISPQGYLVASENSLYVPSGRAMPAAFDRENGRFLYYCSPGGKVGGTWALLAEGELIAGVDLSGTPAKMAYDSKTGKRKGNAYKWFPALDMVVTSDITYILSTGGIHAIDRAEYPAASKMLSALMEERQNLGKLLTDLRAGLSKVDAGTEAMAEGETDTDSQMDKITERINALATEEEKLLKDMACKWQYLTAEAKDFRSMILTGDILFVGGEGIIMAVDAETGDETWKYQVDGVSLGLAAADGNLFVSTDKGLIYCFGEGTASRAKEVKTAITPSPYRKDKQLPDYEAAAEKIVRETGIKKGYCLVLDSGIGRLAYELAKRTDLKIIGIESNARRVARARKALDAAGLYGSRVVVEQWDLSSLPDCFANLIVSDAAMVSSRSRDWSAEMLRVLRPYGGVAYIPATSSWMPTPDDGCQTKESSLANQTMIIRGKLKGAGSWTQLYGDPQNTACSGDELVNSPLGILWFGEPGPEKMVNRHGRAVSPVSINGRIFIQGGEIIMAYDAYNGTFLWEREIPGAVRVRADVDGGNLVATEDGLYVAAFDKCYRLDPATGETVRTYEIPPSPDNSPRRWGYISCVDKVLFGSTATPLRAEYADIWKNYVQDDGTWKSLDLDTLGISTRYRSRFERYISEYPVADEKARADLQRSGTLWRSMTNFPSWSSQRSPKGALTERMMAANSLFAMNTETGELLWQHNGDRIANIAVTIGNGAILFAEATVTDEQREEALDEKQGLISNGVYEEGSEASLAPEDAEVRLVVALNATTGEKLWEKPLDLTGCGGDKMGAAYHNDADLLLFFGCFSNHDKGLFRDGSLKWRRITAIKADTGDVVWSRPLNYLRRPLIVGDEIIIEPRACDVRTGEIKMSAHPVTGQEVPWEFLRPGHSCSITSASANAIFYRSYCHAIYDLAEDRGLALVGAVRPGCWLSPISANGLFISPEASSGCTCSFPIRSSFVMKKKELRKPDKWTVFIRHGSMTPAKHFAINFGAPGDMKDDEGTLWFGYPRPRIGYGVKFRLNEEITAGMGAFCYDFKDAPVEDSNRPWLFTSGYLGLERCEIPLIDDTWGEKPAVYTVRLGFMALPDDRKGERVFDIRLQGKSVLRNLDIVKAAGGQGKAVVKEFSGVAVKDKLTVEFIPRALNPTMTQTPIINSIEIIREDAGETAVEAPRAVRILEADEAEARMEKAKAELDSKNYEAAMDIYHTILDSSSSVDLKLQALDGLAVIGSPKSLNIIAKYCRDVSPILWNYRKSDPKLKNGAIQVYAAIAKNMAAMDKQKAIKMLKRAMTIAGGLDIRQQVIADLVGLGVEIDAD